MAKGIREVAVARDLEPASLSELIHQQVRVAIEAAVHEELLAALGAAHSERSDVRRGYRNGTKTRTLTGPTGLVALTLPRATLFAGAKEWTSRIVPRYHRRMPEVNEAIVCHVLGRRQHPADSWCASAAAQERASFEERRVARDRHSERRSGGMTNALTG